MTLATLQHLRSFTGGEHPLNLEPGQIAFNMATENFDPATNNFNMYLYVGNSSNQRIDEGGTVLVNGGEANKGWVRYSLRNVNLTEENTVFGDFTVAGATLEVESNGASLAELVLPKENDTPTNGTSVGSIRWNTQSSILQAWNGVKWDTTSKVFVSETAPANPSDGDLWLDVGPPSVLRVYSSPDGGVAEWISASSSEALTALQPGNGVTANADNEIETINTGTF